MRSDREIADALDRCGDAVWRVCILHFKNVADAEDAFQETFIKYSTNDDKIFESEEHQKAWLIRVASNLCKDLLRSTKRRATPIGGDAELSIAETERTNTDENLQLNPHGAEILDAVRNLPDPPRTPLYLALYEGYSAPEISDMLDAPINTVYSWVSRGKKLLRKALR